MTGLEGILKKIEEDARAAAKDTLEKANKEAAQILAAAEAEGVQIRDELMEKAEREAKIAISRAESSSDLLEKRLVLEARQEMIDYVINKAKNTILSLPDGEYLQVVLKMIKRYALPGTGKIVFSKTDLSRIPEGFEMTVNSVLQGRGHLEISKEAGDISGGFVLVYGDVEVNCSLDALISSEMESLRDKVNQVLFRKIDY